MLPDSPFFLLIAIDFSPVDARAERACAAFAGLISETGRPRRCGLSVDRLNWRLRLHAVAAHRLHFARDAGRFSAAVRGPGRRLASFTSCAVNQWRTRAWCLPRLFEPSVRWPRSRTISARVPES